MSGEYQVDEEILENFTEADIEELMRQDPYELANDAKAMDALVAKLRQERQSFELKEESKTKKKQDKEAGNTKSAPSVDQDLADLL